MSSTIDLIYLLGWIVSNLKTHQETNGLYNFDKIYMSTLLKPNTFENFNNFNTFSQ